MDVCHVLLDRPWKFDTVVYDGRANTFTFEKDGRRHTLHPLKDKNPEEQVCPRVMLVGGKEFLHELKDNEINYVVLGKPQTILTNTKIDELSIEV